MNRLRNRCIPSVTPMEDRILLDATSVPITEQVLAFARSKVGEQVGNGQCAVLALEAVDSAKGVSMFTLTPQPFTDDTSYVWGKLVTTLTPTDGDTSGITPGDILQYKDVVLKETRTVVSPSGDRTETGGGQDGPHHTAIVSDLLSDSGTGHDIGVYQQNVAGVQKVGPGFAWGGDYTGVKDVDGRTITVKHTMVRGEIFVYEPYANVGG